LGDPTGGALPIFFIPSGAFAAGALMILGLGIAAGIFPALHARRLQVAEALRRD
jgi:ABC-type antimicrobial peptide transport system permease subunit